MSVFAYTFMQLLMLRLYRLWREEYVHCVQKSKNNWLNKASYLYQCRYCSLTKECPPTTLGPIS